MSANQKKKCKNNNVINSGFLFLCLKGLFISELNTLQAKTIVQKKKEKNNTDIHSEARPL